MIQRNTADGFVNTGRLALVGACCALAAWAALGAWQAVGAAVGAVLAVVNAWLLADTVHRAGQAALRGAAAAVQGRSTAIYTGVGVRWAVLLAGLAVGVGWLRLSPVGLLAGYGVVTVAATVIVNSRH